MMTAPMPLNSNWNLIAEPILPAGYAYSFVDLQAVAHARYHLLPQQTLTIAMKLYSRGLITYPRTKQERLLPANGFEAMAQLVTAYMMATGSREYDASYKAPGWADEGPLPHHGITLTTVAAGALFGIQLSDLETAIYGLVHARILEMFVRPAAPPAPGYVHNLVDLQREAQAQYGMSPSETLTAAQGLYKRNLITNPATDERRLAQFMFEEAASIISSYIFVSGSEDYDPTYEAPCWTRDVGLDMGIMPRGMPAAALFGFSMSEAETRIYGLVHARFLSLFIRPAA